MNDFFKYLTVGEEDKKWGLYLNVAGKAQIEAKSIYPSPEHPTGYHFTWESGRILDEFQINYITNGGGILENEHGKFQIKPGTLLITRPGVWHRYRPLKKTGWLENYIGFDGKLARQILSNPIIPLEQTIFYFGIREEFLDSYYKIFDIIQKEEPGYQQIASGLIVKLLGYIIAFNKQRNFSGGKVEDIIQKVRFQMRERVEQEIDFVELAKQNNIGYSYFRRMFKKYTGISPHQYHLELKIMRARELILSTEKNIKEISYELGFHSIYYFSRFFKKKVGKSPTDFRKQTSRS